MFKVFSVFLLSLFSQASLAFIVTPSAAQIEPTSSNASAVFQITNKDSSDITVLAFIKEKSVNAQGVETLTDSKEKEFLIFPSQIKIKAKSTASVRLMYVGKKNIKQERPFRLAFIQASDPNGKRQRVGKTDVELLFSIRLNVYVTPKAAKAQVVASIVTDKDGTSKIKVENTGDRRAALKSAKVVLKTDDKEVAVDTKDRLRLPVLSKATREIALPKDLKISPKAEVLIKEE